MYLPLKRSFEAHTMDSVRERSSLRLGLCYIYLPISENFSTFAADFEKNLPIENPNTILEEMLSSLDFIGEIWQI